jgi:aspartate/glutamate racemase
MLCDSYRALTGGASPDVLVHSISAQRHLVEAFSGGSLRPEQREALQHLVTRTCRSLAHGGADVIAIACSATTVDAAATVAATPIGMVEAARNRLQRLGARRVGLLAPSTMLSSAAYARGLAEAGIIAVVPGPRDQAIVDRFAEALQWSTTQVPVPGAFARVVAELSGDVDALVLDCADLCGVVDAEMVGRPVIDSVAALVDECCRALLAPVPAAPVRGTSFDTSAQLTLRAPVPQTDCAEPDPDTRVMPAFPYASYPWPLRTSGERADRPGNPKWRGLGALIAGFIGVMCLGAAAGSLAVHFTAPTRPPAAVGQPAQTGWSAQTYSSAPSATVVAFRGSANDHR